MNNGNGFAPNIVSRYEEVLKHFAGEQRRKSTTDADVICPVHDDSRPSLGVDLRQNGAGPRIVVNCRSQGCEYTEILKATGLTDEDLRFSPKLKPPDSVIGAQSSEQFGCTLEEYAAAKKLPLEFLTHKYVGLFDSTCYVKQAGEEVPSVAMPYPAPDGSLLALRHRIALGGDDRFRWRSGDKTTLYGLHRLDEVQDAGYTLLVEGESDCHSAWHVGRPAIGVPGAKNWRDEWAEYLADIAKIFVLVEPDEAGKELWARLARCKAIADRLIKVGG
jgi:putative DNA primase/helicase